MTQNPNWIEEPDGYDCDTAKNIQVATEELCKRLDQQNRLLGHLIMALLVEYSAGTQAPFVNGLKDIFK